MIEHSSTGRAGPPRHLGVAAGVRRAGNARRFHRGLVGVLLAVLVVACTFAAATGSAGIVHRAVRAPDAMIAAAPASAARPPCDGAGRSAAKACSLTLLGFGPLPAALGVPRSDGTPAHLAGVHAASLTAVWLGSPPFRPPRPAA